MLIKSENLYACQPASLRLQYRQTPFICGNTRNTLKTFCLRLEYTLNRFIILLRTYTLKLLQILSLTTIDAILAVGYGHGTAHALHVVAAHVAGQVAASAQGVKGPFAAPCFIHIIVGASQVSPVGQPILLFVPQFPAPPATGGL